MTAEMKVIDDFLSKCEYYGGAKFRKEFLAKNEYYAKMWEAGDKKDVEEELEYTFNHSSFAEAVKVVKEAIGQMSFEDALQATLRIIHAAEKINDERVIISLPVWAKSFLTGKVDPENLEEFLASILEPLVSPNDILSKFATALPVIRKMLLEKYDGKINLKSFSVFGDDSIFKDFEDRAEREKEIVGKILAQMSSKLCRERERYSPGMFGGSYKTIEADPYDIQEVTKFFSEAVKAGVVPPNYKEIIDALGDACYRIDGYFSDSFQGNVRRGVASIATEIEKVLGEISEGITGKGLEFLSVPGGAQKIYLDSKLILTVANADFSEQATNGEVVAWVEREQIDYCTIKGAQNRDTVYAWKNGWEDPKQLFEDHAYASERYFRILPPRVSSDGKVRFNRIDGEKEEEKEFSV